jgi:hypothetical protein
LWLKSSIEEILPMTKNIENLLRIAIFLFAVWVFSELLSSRHQIVAVGNYLAYKLDTWTGKVYYIDSQGERVVKKSQ